MLWGAVTFVLGAISGGIVHRRLASSGTKSLSEENRRQSTIISHAKEERSALLKEVHHRVKNNLQVILSIFNLQVRRIADSELKQTLQEATNRIQVIAVLHQTLYQSESFSDIDIEKYFNEITRFLVGGVVGQRQPVILFTCTIPPVSIDRAIPLGLILMELVTNSIKYAWQPDSLGLVNTTTQRPEITIGLSPGADSQTAEFDYADNGRGFSESFDIESASSLGSKLIVILTKQLKGSVNVISGAEQTGARLHLQFPLGKSNSYTGMERNYG